MATSAGGTTKEAESGTRSHSWLSYLVRSGNGEYADTPEGVTADERSRAEWAYKQVKSIAEELGVKWLNSETTRTIKGLGVLDGIYGTSDIDAIAADRILVIDYKTYSQNTVDMTAQPEGYALAIHSENPFAPHDVEVVIIHAGSYEVQRKRTTVEEILERATRIVGGHVSGGNPCPNTYCKYCANANSCPGVEKAIEVVKAESRFLALPLAQQLVIVKQVESICKRVEQSVKDELDKQIEAGKPIEQAEVSGGGVTWHYKLKNGSDKLSDICGLAGLAAEKGVDNAALMSICTVSKTAITDKLLSANAGMKAAEAKRLIKPFYTPGKPSRQLERVA